MAVAEPFPAEKLSTTSLTTVAPPVGLPARIPARPAGPMIIDVQPAPTGISARLMFLVAVLVVSLTVWIVHSRQPFDAQIHAVAPAPIAPKIAAATHSAVPVAPAAPAANSPPVDAAPAPATNGGVAAQNKPADTSAKAATRPLRAVKVTSAGRKAAGKVDAMPKISIAAGGYWVRPGGHFAEIHVRRSSRTSGDASFVWWTEPLSAHADEDYFSQAHTTQTFSAGLRFASLFIRVIPNASRKSPRVFYVVIGTPSAGNALGRFTRVPVVLQP